MVCGIFVDVSLTKRLLFSALIVVVLSMSMWGAVSTGMMMQDGTMQNCPFMGVTALCNMNLLEHLTAWQSMFNAIPASIASVFLLLSLLALVFLAYGRVRELFYESIDSLAVLVQLYARRSLAFAYANSLQQAFSDGILNPKVY